MNKNEALARCRMIYAIVARDGCNKFKAIKKIHGTTKPFNTFCPLCDYTTLKDDYNTVCANCINWGSYINLCMSPGSNYMLHERAVTPSEYQNAGKMILKTIDKAIACYDRTGDWK